MMQGLSAVENNPKKGGEVELTAVQIGHKVMVIALLYAALTYYP